jgi:hypothetical protein
LGTTETYLQNTEEHQPFFPLLVFLFLAQFFLVFLGVVFQAFLLRFVVFILKGP